jgi:hypothetical protein
VEDERQPVEIAVRKLGAPFKQAHGGKAILMHRKRLPKPGSRLEYDTWNAMSRSEPRTSKAWVRATRYTILDTLLIILG